MVSTLPSVCLTFWASTFLQRINFQFLSGWERGFRVCVYLCVRVFWGQGVGMDLHLSLYSLRFSTKSVFCSIPHLQRFLGLPNLEVFLVLRLIGCFLISYFFRLLLHKTRVLLLSSVKSITTIHPFSIFQSLADI